MVKSVKEESNIKKSFDINKLSAGDREVLTRKSPYLYKIIFENLVPDSAGIDLHNKSSDKVEVIKNNNCDELLRKSANVMNKSINARRIIENVIERIESNYGN